MKTKQEFLSITIVVSLILSLLFLSGFFEAQNTRLTDSLHGGKETLENIVIIAIDDKSIQEIGRWPWDRKIFAEAFKHLKTAKIVGVDIAFFEPSNAESDSALAKQVRGNNNIILPMEYTKFQIQQNKITGAEILQPYKDLKESAKAQGYINIITDKDGITRSVNLDVGGDYDSFTNLVYKNYLNKDFPKTSKFRIAFLNQPGSFTTYSMIDLINSKITEEKLQNKIILIGATSPDLHDDYFVPTSNGKAMPGVEVHATILQNMITNTRLAPQPRILVILIIIILSIITFASVKSMGILKSLFILIPILIIIPFTAIFLFNYGVLQNIIYPLLAIILTYILTLVFCYKKEKKQKKQIANAFEKYVSPEVVREILEDPSKLRLGGTKQEITVLFSDIRGFTALSEKLKPEELVHILNEYLAEMTEIIIKNKGVVDKFIGDAIMAFWGAPIKEENHSDLALKSALEMISSLKELNKKLKTNLSIGIGLNTGEAIIGNMGSYKRFDYTAIGDNINLGSRLESLNKQYGTSIIISENTKKHLSGNYKMRELDYIKVKGKEKAVKIYEVITDKNTNIKDFETAIHKYKSQKFENAIEIFKKINDPASRLFVERSYYFIKNPPKKDWDGSFQMVSK